MNNIDSFQGVLKNVIQSTMAGIASVYEDFVYEGYITPKYMQRLNNIRLLTIHNIKEIPECEIKTDLLTYIKLLEDMQKNLKEEKEDDELILMYLLLKFFLFMKKNEMNFNYKGNHLVLNPKALEDNMVEFNDEIYEVFGEYLIEKIDNDMETSALSLDNL